MHIFAIYDILSYLNFEAYRMNILTFAGSAGACLCVGLLAYSVVDANRTEKRKTSEMREFLFPLVVRSAFIKQNPGLSEEKQEHVFRELRAYYQVLLRDHQSGRLKAHRAPPAHVEAAWSVFIQCRDQYEAFCHRFFGHVLPTQPAN